MSVTAPATVDAALAALAVPGGADLIAGGTDLMVAVNAGRRALGPVVAVDRIAELRRIRHLDDVEGEVVELGAGVTFTDLLGPDVAPLLPGLTQAARTVGSPQIRNAGTIGGNLATASPAADAVPMLVALDATVVLRSADGGRELPIGDFLVGPKRTALRPGELITAVRVRVPHGPQEFLKIGTRNAMVISVCSVAAVADADARTVRFGLGSVGPTVLRAPDAEAAAADAIDWAAGSVDAAAAGEVGRLAAAESRPIDDHRATAAYRRHCVGVLVERALLRMFPGAGG